MLARGMILADKVRAALDANRGVSYAIVIKQRKEIEAALAEYHAVDLHTMPLGEMQRKCLQKRPTLDDLQAEERSAVYRTAPDAESMGRTERSEKIC